MKQSKQNQSTSSHVFVMTGFAAALTAQASMVQRICIDSLQEKEAEAGQAKKTTLTTLPRVDSKKTKNTLSQHDPRYIQHTAHHLNQPRGTTQRLFKEAPCVRESTRDSHIRHSVR